MRIGSIAGRELGLAMGLLLIGIVSRILAIPASFWEWDEIGFARALHHYDIGAHSPHPPGFPVFIAMGRIAWSLWQNDQAALISVNLLFSATLGVVLYLLYREILNDRPIALAGALLGLFTPAIWIYGGFGRSDNPALVTGLLVIWLALCGRRSSRALWAGALLLGLGSGIRVTMVPFAGPVLGLVLLRYLVRREWRAPLKALIAATAGWLSWYVPLIRLTGWSEYNAIMRVQSAFISTHDTIWSGEWSLEERLNGFFISVWGDWRIAAMVYLTAGIGGIVLLLSRRRAALGWLLLAFVPVLVFTTVVNTPTAAAVYSLPYLPLFTILGACGLMSGARALGGLVWSERPMGLATFALTVPFLLAALSAIWTYPTIRLIHRTPSPPAQAISYLQKRVDQSRDKIYFDERMLQHATYHFRTRGETEIEERLKDEEIALNLVHPENRYFQKTFLLTDERPQGEISQHFRWPGGAGLERLRPLSFGRYFDLYVSEAGRSRDYAWSSGWYDFEREGLQIWRWMGSTGRIALFNGGTRMRLRIRGRLPVAGEPLRIAIDGDELARVGGPEVDYRTTITIPGAGSSGPLWSILSLEAGQTFVPARSGGGGDLRELGFQCFGIEWEPVEGSEERRIEAAEFLGDGWLELQIGQPRSWRWAERVASVRLPRLDTSHGRLHLILETPLTGSTITLRIDGEVVGSVSPLPGERVNRVWSVEASRCRSGECRLQLESSAPVAGRAFKVTSLTWRPE